MHTIKNSFKTVMVRLGTIAAAILLGGSLLLTHSSSLADDTQQDAAFTCASAVNVMDCISQTGTGAVKQSEVTSIPINSQALGFTGPVSVGIRYDNYLAWIMDVGYAQSFYNAAAAFKLSAGLNERRANVTLGYSITPKQQIKLTYEYLAQNLPFDYSTGTVNEWVNQNAFGAAYRYMLDYGIVRALEVYGNYTKANSKELSDVEMYTDSQLTAIDQRRIAGGTQQNYGAAVTLTPFENTILKVGGGYSTLSFNTEWSDPQKQSAIAYDVELSRLLTPKTMVSAGIGNTAAGQTYTAKVSRILPWSLEGALTGQYMATTNDIPGSTSVTASLSYPAPKTYTNMFAAGIGNLKDWVQQPVIYNTRVLAKAEERKISVAITKTKDIPAQNVPAGTDIKDVLTKDYFSFNPEVLDKIDYVPTVVQKGTTTSVPLSALNLSYKSLDSYNGELSSGQVPASAMTPGTYTVTIQAAGYRGPTAVTTASSSFDITVGANETLANGTWVTSAQLPVANANDPYPNVSINTLVKDNSNIGDIFVFDSLTVDPPSPQWLQFSQDHKSIIAAGKVPQNAQNPTKITLTGHSTVSNKPILDPNNKDKTQETYSITVNYNATGPTWKNPNGENLPDTAYQKQYLDINNGGINYNVGSFILNTGNSTDTIANLIYTCTSTNCSNAAQGQNLPVKGLLLYPNGNIAGAPNDLSQINQSYTFTVQAKNTSQMPSADLPITINVVQNSAWPSPTWGPNELQIAAVSTLYSQDLNDYVLDNGQKNTGTLSYVVDTSNGGSNGCNKWLSWYSDRSNIISGTPQDTDAGTCKITIKATSSAGGQPSIFSKTISVASKTVSYKNKPIPNATYLQNYPTVNFNDGTYFWDGVNSNGFTFSNITVPAGMSLSSDGLLTGKPSDINNIDNATLKFTVTSSQSGVAPLPFTAVGFDVVSDPGLSPNPIWNSQSLPQANATVEYGDQNVNVNTYFNLNPKAADDSITYYDLTNNGCSWLSIDNTTGKFSGKPTSSDIGTCAFTVTVKSKASGTTVPIKFSGVDKQQQITVAGNAPVWKDTAIYNVPFSYPDSSRKLKLEDYIDTTKTDLSKITVTFDLISTPVNPFPTPNMMPTTIDHPDANYYVTINAPIQDDVDNSRHPTGTFKIKATNGGTGEESYGIFNVQITADLTNPQVKAGAQLKPVSIGNPYPSDVTLNPYSNNSAYMNQTKVTNSNNPVEYLISDSLTFNEPTGTQQQPSCNQSGGGWANLNPNGDGTISGTPPTNVSQPGLCYLNFTVTSVRNGNKLTPAYIPIQIAQPVTWKPEANDPQSLQFDATNNLHTSNGVPIIDLNDLVYQDSTRGTIIFNLTQNDDQNRFQIISQRYLVLNEPSNNTLDGTLVGKDSNITINATYQLDSTQYPSPQNLKIHFTPDSNTKVQWNSADSSCAKTIDPVTQNSTSTDNGSFTLPKNCITSSVYNYKVTDTITVSPNANDNVLQASQAPNTPYSSPNPSVDDTNITIKNPLGHDLGLSYNLIFNNLKSNASGDATINLNIGTVLTVGPNLIITFSDSDTLFWSSGYYYIAINLAGFDKTRSYFLNQTDITSNGNPGTLAPFVVCPFQQAGAPFKTSGCKGIPIQNTSITFGSGSIGDNGTVSIIWLMTSDYDATKPYKIISIKITPKT